MNNTLKTILILILFSFSNLSKSNEIKTPDEGVINFIKQNDENYPLALTIINNGKTTLIDKYSFEGGEPELNDSSFLQIDNNTLFLVLISWNVNHYDIKGTQYQTFIYKYENKTLHQYSELNNDSNLSGFIGYTNDLKNQEYDYNNIEEIKKYLQKKLHYGENDLFSCILNNNKKVTLKNKNNQNYYVYRNNNNIELQYPLSNEKPISFDNGKDTISFSRGGYIYYITKKKINDYNLSVKNDNKIIFNKPCKNIITPFPSNINEYFN
ncbi:hypothetical protein VFES401_15715 [Aliivibrio fischeri]|uniref:hypothetical protein n=1 Tax=Aliivibrio fischeri TaxID=668 RepID=UPI0007C46154|nr:hypothetical protein [Aliivibrio fischeri]TGA68324.1 hypothetical protein VFES401_15715 [Aliivibrio fischeri]